MDANHWHRYFIDILKHLDIYMNALSAPSIILRMLNVTPNEGES